MIEIYNPLILNEAQRSEESLHKAKYFNFTTLPRTHPSSLIPHPS